jgi:hypothetical protein
VQRIKINQRIDACFTHKKGRQRGGLSVNYASGLLVRLLALPPLEWDDVTARLADDHGGVAAKPKLDQNFVALNTSSLVCVDNFTKQFHGSPTCGVILPTHIEGDEP